MRSAGFAAVALLAGACDSQETAGPVPLRLADLTATQRARLVAHPAFHDDLSGAEPEADFARLREYFRDQYDSRVDAGLAREALAVVDDLLAPPERPLASVDAKAEDERRFLALESALSSGEPWDEDSSREPGWRHRALQAFRREVLARTGCFDAETVATALEEIRAARAARARDPGVAETRIDAPIPLSREADRGPWSSRVLGAAIESHTAERGNCERVLLVGAALELVEADLGGLAAVHSPTPLELLDDLVRTGARPQRLVILERHPLRAEFWRRVLRSAREDGAPLLAFPYAFVDSRSRSDGEAEARRADTLYESLRPTPKFRATPFAEAGSPRALREGRDAILATRPAVSPQALPGLFGRIELEARVRWRRVELPASLAELLELREASVVADRFGEDAEFDLVVCLDELELEPIAVRALAWLNLARAARPGALLYCSLTMATQLGQVAAGWRWIGTATHAVERPVFVYQRASD